LKLIQNPHLLKHIRQNDIPTEIYEEKIDTLSNKQFYVTVDKNQRIFAVGISKLNTSKTIDYIRRVYQMDVKFKFDETKFKQINKLPNLSKHISSSFSDQDVELFLKSK